MDLDPLTQISSVIEDIIIRCTAITHQRSNTSAMISARQQLLSAKRMIEDTVTTGYFTARFQELQQIINHLLSAVEHRQDSRGITPPVKYPRARNRQQRGQNITVEMLTFLKVNGLPSDNNLAERMIRPNVIFRKISFENMSEKGARAHEVLMSLLQTLRLQKMEPSAFNKRAYLAHRQGRPTPLLSLITA